MINARQKKVCNIFLKSLKTSQNTKILTNEELKERPPKPRPPQKKAMARISISPERQKLETYSRGAIIVKLSPKPNPQLGAEVVIFPTTHPDKVIFDLKQCDSQKQSGLFG